MTAAVIILASALAAAIALAALLGVWLHTANADLLAARQDLVMEQRRGDTLEHQRDAEIVARAESDATAKEALRRLAAADVDRNLALAKESEHAAETVRGAGTGALDAINRVLLEGKASDDAARPAAAGGAGNGGAPAVSPAADADPYATRR